MSDRPTSPTTNGPGEQPKNPHDLAKAQNLKSIWEYLRDSKWRNEFNASINESYYKGEHYLIYDLQNNQVSTATETTNTTVNRVKEKVTQAISFLTRDNFRFDVQPAEGVDPTELDETRKEMINAERDWADYQFRRQEISAKTPEVALDGAKFSLGWWMTGYDPEAEVVLDDGQKIKGDVWIDVAKWWYTYWDPMARTLDTQRFMAYAEPTTIGELKRKYPNAQHINPDEKMSPSQYEERIRKYQYSGQTVGSFGLQDELRTAIRVRIWYWDWNGNKRELREACITEDGLILEDKKHPYGDWFPFEEFRWDAPGGTIDGEGLVKQIREPNKTLNTLVNSLVEYANSFKGKILEPRKANVEIIDDEHGERVLYDAQGGEPKYWSVPPINPAVNTGIEYMERKIDDLSMIHATFAGKTEFTGQSGIHAEVMATGDANNFAITKNNLHRSLARIFKKALLIAAQQYQKGAGAPRSMYSKTSQRRFQIAGQDINLDDNITVGTQASFAQTKQFLIDTVMKLGELGWIGPKQGLKAFEFTEVDEVLQELQENQEGLATSDSDAAVAELENRAIAAGQKPAPPQPGFNFQVHQEIHSAYLKSPEVANNDTVKGRLMALMDHEAQINEQAGALPPEAGAALPPGMPIEQPAPQPMPAAPEGGVPPNAAPQ